MIKKIIFWLVDYSLALVFASIVLLIQEGLTYYVSVQTVALFFLAGVMLHAGLVVRFTSIALATYILFSVLLLCTATVMPDTISQNSPNIVITTIGMLGYVSLILAMNGMHFVRAEWLLRLFRRSAAATIVAIVAFVVITDLGIISGMNREYFIRQNVGLITNYTTVEAIEQDLLMRNARGLPLDIDLFYGEQSFLVLVIFVSLVSYVTSTRALDRLRGSDVRSAAGKGIRGAGIALMLGVAGCCMIYIQSLSALLYTVVLLGFVALNLLRREGAIRLTEAQAAALFLLLMVISWVAIETAPYYWHRLTTFRDSLSTQQRFGILFDFLPQDFLLGLHERTRMPSFGFQNGLVYIVMVAGIGGICLVAYQLYRIARLAHPLGLVTLNVAAVLAVFTQSGAILSPNKLVILSFLLVPLMSQNAVSALPRI